MKFELRDETGSSLLPIGITPPRHVLRVVMENAEGNFLHWGDQPVKLLGVLYKILHFRRDKFGNFVEETVILTWNYH